MTKCWLGFDIGGTKCAAILGQAEGEQIRIIERKAFPTPVRPESTLLKLEATARELLADNRWQPEAIGISCGGPLDSRRGIILGPPNLPGWDNVPVSKRFSTTFGVLAELALKLQEGLLAIPLMGFMSLATAFANDIDPQSVFAQRV